MKPGAGMLRGACLASVAATALGFQLLGTGWASEVPWHAVVLRLMVVGFALGAWFSSQALLGARGFPAIGVGDRVHDWTAGLHAYLQRHTRLANGLLIASSAGIDLFGLFLVGVSVFGESLRPFAALLILFAMRQVCQAICALPAPPGMIWRHPGFPSLLVTYGTANDFFFSGHTAIAVLGAVTAFEVLPAGVAAGAAAVAVLEALTVVVLRAHWTLDVLAAVLAAFVAHDIATLLPL